MLWWAGLVESRERWRIGVGGATDMCKLNYKDEIIYASSSLTQFRQNIPLPIIELKTTRI